MQLATMPTPAPTAAPEDLLDVLANALHALVGAPAPSSTTGSRAQWAQVVACCQRVVNAASGMQDEAIVALARVETIELDDGTVTESHRSPGHVALGAPAIVSGALAVSAVHAERRVRAAVRLADGPTGTPAATGLRALHDAQRRGDLDAYRAGVVAEELELAPAQVAAAVLATLGEHVHTDTAPQLRGRCRTVLSRVSPDLVRQRAERARARCALRRWAEEPGVDKWEGTFPSADAARAWAAIDARAQQLVTEGTCTHVDGARARALIDLVTGSATITTHLTLTIPATTMTPADDVPELPDPSDRNTTRDMRDTGDPRDPRDPKDTRDTSDPSDPRGSRDSSSEKSQFSGTSGNPDATATVVTAETRPATTATTATTGSPDDLVEVSMGARGERVLLPRAFLDAATTSPDSTIMTGACHPTSGALLDDTATSAHRPPTALAALVRQRDGHCRFPGCHVNARFRDLDHVRPWPTGPTTATNLVSLCRRHHRIKQRLGWRVRLHPDGATTWTDPTGRTRTTTPVNALRLLVLPARLGTPEPEPSLIPAVEDPPNSNTAHGAGATDPYSALEFALEHHQAALTVRDHIRAAELRHVPRTPGTGRLRIDLHDPAAAHPDPAHRDLGRIGARDSRHRTSCNDLFPNLGHHHDEVPDHPPF